MFDTAPYLEQPEERQSPDSIDVREHLHRINTDYGFRNEIRREMLGAIRSVFSTKPPRTG